MSWSGHAPLQLIASSSRRAQTSGDSHVDCRLMIQTPRLALLVTIAAFPLMGRAQDCHQSPDIFVGGISGFTDLAAPEHTRALRGSCRVGLYLHRAAWNATPQEQQQAILAAFKGTGVPVIEFGMSPNPAAWFEHVYPQWFRDRGVTAQEAHINGFNLDHPVSEWTDFVDAGRSRGKLSLISVVFSPNTGELRRGQFNSAAFDRVRAAAIYGGGLTIDAPPDFFRKQPEAYRKFTIDEILWANSQHIHSSVIVSPGKSGGDFLELTEKFVSTLQQAHATPTEYIVENYEPNASAGYLNNVGDENSSRSIAGVAMWLTQHAKTVDPLSTR
jgi:hypothetical protein